MATSAMRQPQGQSFDRRLSDVSDGGHPPLPPIPVKSDAIKASLAEGLAAGSRSARDDYDQLRTEVAELRAENKRLQAIVESRGSTKTVSVGARDCTGAGGGDR